MKKAQPAPICEVRDIRVCQNNDQYAFYVVGIFRPQFGIVKKTFRRAVVGEIITNNQTRYIKWFGPDPEVIKRDLCWGIGLNPEQSPYTGFYWMEEQPIQKGGVNLHFFAGIVFESETLEDARKFYGEPLYITTDKHRPLALSELHEKQLKEKITYSDILETQKWQDRRLQILLRDEFACRKCRKTGTASVSELGDDLVRGIMPVIAPDGSLVGYYEDDLFPALRIPGKEKTPLHVHHKRYILGRWPWDYPDDDLITLCESCHLKVHAEEKIQYHNDEGERLSRDNFTPCIRCVGNGYIPEYNHVENGICFRCRGARYEEVILGLTKHLKY